MLLMLKKETLKIEIWTDLNQRESSVLTQPNFICLMVKNKDILIMLFM